MENPIGMSPVPPPPEQKKKGWVIAAIVAGVLVCCICLLAVGGGVYLYINQPTPIPTSAPTRMPTSTPEPSVNIVGTWQLSFDWDCGGNEQTGSFTFNANGTFTDGRGSPGTWTLTGTQIVIGYDNGTTYTGQFDGSTMSGEMVAFDGATGCWQATR